MVYIWVILIGKCVKKTKHNQDTQNTTHLTNVTSEDMK